MSTLQTAGAQFPPILSYRNWASELGSLASTSSPIEAEAPWQRMLNPRALQPTIWQASNNFNFVLDWAGPNNDGYPVELITLVNVNIVSLTGPNALTFTLQDTAGNNLVSQVSPANTYLMAGQGTYYNLYHRVPQTGGALNRQRVRRITTTLSSNARVGTYNMHTGRFSAQPFALGVYWAGPVWRPKYGAKFEGFTYGSTDENSQRAETPAGQRYNFLQMRRRRLVMNFSALPESEVNPAFVAGYSEPNSSFITAPSPSLFDLSVHCGLSRPLIALPATATQAQIAQYGMYGYLESELTWPLFDRTTKEGRLFTASLQMKQAL